MHVFSLGGICAFPPTPSYRSSHGKTEFLEISFYQLYHLGCYDVRDYPCQRSWLSLSQTIYSKVVPFPTVIQFMLPTLSKACYGQEARSRLTSKVIKLKLQNPLLCAGFFQGPGRDSHNVFSQLYFSLLLQKPDSFKIFLS